MRTKIQKLFVFALVCTLMLSLLYVPSVYALTSTTRQQFIERSFPKLTVNVEIEVEGISLQDASGLKYQITRSKSLNDLGKYYGGSDLNIDVAVIPNLFEKKILTAKYQNGKLVDSLTFAAETSIVDNYYTVLEDLLWFEPATGTDSHYSIEGVEIVSGASRYTYTGQDSRANNTQAAEAYNCIKPSYATTSTTGQRYISTLRRYMNIPVISSSVTSHTINLKLKLRYNPGIDEKKPPEDPKPEYSKTITPYEGKDNSYRLALTLDTPKPKEKEAEKDVIFVLDTSASMSAASGGGLTRIEALRQALTSTVNKLAESETTRMSIVLFGTEYGTLMENKYPFTEANSITRTINDTSTLNAGQSRANGKSMGPGTNYYGALTEAQRLVGNVPGSREAIIFFITDGLPTVAKPAMTMTTAYNAAYYPAAIYARQAAQGLHPGRFYGIFVGSDEGQASELQAVTQQIQLKQSKNSEKFMIKASNTTEFNRAMERFVAFLDNSLYNVVIKDEISEYLDYAGKATVTARQTDESGRVTEKTLVSGEDYNLTVSGKHVTMELLKSATPSTLYTLSFDVKANRKGLDYFYDRMDKNGDGIEDAPETIYPNVGDPNTGANSSGQYGLLSNVRATLQYSFGGSKTFTADYPHPVFQITPNMALADVEMKKNLIGRNLKDGEFSFQLYDEKGAVSATATNSVNGDIRFTGLRFAIPGTYKFTAKEVIPATQNPTITYDTKEIPVVITVSVNADNDMTASVSFPSGNIFTNEYQPLAVDVTIDAVKQLKGDRELTAGMFEFYLVDHKNKKIQEHVPNQAPNGGDNRGKIVFNPITFDKAGVYNYKIWEAPIFPIDDSIEYDLNPVEVEIVVVDNDGQLEATLNYSKNGKEDNKTFVNKYITPVDAEIEIPVILTGMKLKSGLFQYELREYNGGDQGGELLATAGNNTKDSVRFTITYLKPTEATYIVTQIEPEEDKALPNMIYDNEKKILVHVKVEMDDDAKLHVAEVKTEVLGAKKEKVRFYNVYNILGGTW